jgi:hypothetical protein
MKKDGYKVLASSSAAAGTSIEVLRVRNGLVQEDDLERSQAEERGAAPGGKQRRSICG